MLLGTFRIQQRKWKEHEGDLTGLRDALVASSQSPSALQSVQKTVNHDALDSDGVPGCPDHLPVVLHMLASSAGIGLSWYRCPAVNWNSCKPFS